MYSFSGVVGCIKSCSEDVPVGLLSFLLLLLLVSLLILVESTWVSLMLIMKFIVYAKLFT